MLLLIISGVLHAYSQPVRDVKGLEQVDYYSILANTRFLKVKENLTIDSIRNIADTQFRPIHEYDIKELGFITDYYWFRFNIKNSDTLLKACVLITSNLPINEMELFATEEKGIRSLGKTGNNIPYIQRPYASNYFAYPIVLNPKQESCYYLFINAKGKFLKLPLLLFDDVRFKQFENRTYYMFGVFVGIILLTAFFNLILFVFNKDKIHLIYSLYAFIMIFVLMGLENLDSMFLFPRHTFWVHISRSTPVCIGLFLQFLVMRFFLNQKPGNSKYYHLVTIMMTLYICTPIIGYIISYWNENFILRKIYLWLYVIVILTGFPVAMISCMEKISQGFKPAMFYLAAISATLLGGTIMAINISMVSFTRQFSLLPNVAELGICAESVIICTGIFYRYSLYKRDKDMLMLDLEREKTASVWQVLLAQEDERKRIAEDLHDEIGGSLAAIKMTLQSNNLTEEKNKLLIKLIDDTSRNARNIAHDLMPPEFKHVSLNDLLTQYFQQFNNNGCIKFNFHTSVVLSYMPCSLQSVHAWHIYIQQYYLR